MKKSTAQYIMLAIALVLLAGAAFAYDEPLANPTGQNAYSYITEGSQPGVKLGNLSVYNFTAAQNATLKDQAIFQGVVTGGATNPSTVKFGDKTHTVDVGTNDSLQTNALQSETLKHPEHPGNTLEHLCANASGTYYICN